MRWAVSDLPVGWTQVTLADVGEITTGNTPPTKQTENYGGEIPFVKPGDLDYPFPITKTEQTLSQRGAEFARLLRPGAVLVSCIGNLGKIGIAGVPLATNQQINSIEFTPSLVYDRYGYYFCKTLKPWMEREASATTVTILNKGRFSKAPFVLAPLDEQKRIAEKLDSLLTRVDSCERHLERVPKILKRFRQSVLAAATSGRLTEDWREENAVNGEWETVQLSEVANSRLGKMLDAAKNRGELHPYLRNINVRWFAFDLSDIQELRISEEEAKTLGVRKGDVLVCEGGEPGRCAVWNGEEDIYLFQKALHRVRVGEKLLPEWLCYCLKSSADSGKLAEYFTGTTIKHFTGVSLSRFEFELPSLEEQAEIVRRVESLFAYAERLEARYLSASERVARLTPSLLAKGFRGELVEQEYRQVKTYVQQK